MLVQVPELIEKMKNQGMGDVLVVCGGVIPEQDFEALRAAGVSAIFGPGTQIPKAAIEMINLLNIRGVSS